MEKIYPLRQGSSFPLPEVPQNAPSLALTTAIVATVEYATVSAISITGQKYPLHSKSCSGLRFSGCLGTKAKEQAERLKAKTEASSVAMSLSENRNTFPNADFPVTPSPSYD
jgi:hypothetical protein